MYIYIYKTHNICKYVYKYLKCAFLCRAFFILLEILSKVNYISQQKALEGEKGGQKLRRRHGSCAPTSAFCQW